MSAAPSGRRNTQQAQPGSLPIDRSKPFDLIRGWSIVEEDQRALWLTEIDFSKVRFESGLRDEEQYIGGAKRLERFKQQPGVRLDAKVGEALYEEEGQATLRFIHEHFNVSWFELSGTVMRSTTKGYRYFLVLDREDDGLWVWYYYWLGYKRDRDCVSPLLAS